MIYLDSSALVKRYVEEEGTNIVKSILADNGLIATSKLTYPEILSALMRKVRAGEIERKTFNGIVNVFDRDWEHVLVLDFHNDLLQVLDMLIEKHAIKAADAIHLSSALWLKLSSKADVTFIASDSNLLKAARAEKLQVINWVRQNRCALRLASRLDRLSYKPANNNFHNAFLLLTK